MNRDVFLSILAMDAYNRGDGEGVSGLSATGSIGAATIIRQSDVRQGSSSMNAGFYALSYNWNGETIIAYRGTNFGQLVAAARDILNGWSMFTGFGPGLQPGLARSFFTAVPGTTWRN